MENVISIREMYKDYPVGLGKFTALKDINLDFAWAPYGELGDTYAMSVNFKFDACRRSEVEKPEKKKPVKRPKKLLSRK